jgi:hypothetical protein
MLLSQLISPERLSRLTSLDRQAALISPEEIILQLFSAEELVDDLLFLNLELDAKERAILKAAILQEIYGSHAIKEALRVRIRKVLQTLGRLSAGAPNQPGADAGGTQPGTGPADTGQATSESAATPDC